MGSKLGFSSPSLLVLFCVVELEIFLASLPFCVAEEFTVGGSSGWTLNYNYSQWTAGKTFRVNDTLLFSYSANQHDVVQVDKTGYDGCTTSTTYFNDNGKGSTTVTLNGTGTYYYICTVPGHCSSGMKVAVNVVTASSPPTSSTPSTGSSKGPSTSGSVRDSSVSIATAVVMSIVATCILSIHSQERGSAKSL
eukprot:c22503_g1_i1 orf=139-717(-)